MKVNPGKAKGGGKGRGAHQYTVYHMTQRGELYPVSDPERRECLSPAAETKKGVRKGETELIPCGPDAFPT